MPLQNIKTNICIIGCGPAGTTTSITLSKLGIPHVIVDASAFPRDKICGDALDLNVIRVLNSLIPGFVQNEMTEEDIFFPSPGLRFILPNRKNFEMKQNTISPIKPDKKPLFFISKRTNFDNLLVSKIDRNFADLQLSTRIERIERNGKNWMLYGNNTSGEIEIEASMLVGADGDHSVVLKHIGKRKIDRNNYAGAVRQYWEGINNDGLLELYFPKSLPLSYLWIFPLPNGQANVGFGIASNYIAKKNINVRKAFEDLIKTDDFLSERFKNAKPIETIKGWGLPMSGANRKASGDGWLLVGDAASIICPTNGEGIGSGMLSGYIAAHFLQRAYNENCYEEKMFRNYNNEIHKRLRNDERLFWLANHIPAWAFTTVLNAVLSNRFLQKRVINKELQKWIETAYTKPIKVMLD